MIYADLDKRNEPKKMPLSWLTLKINPLKWELIPKKKGMISWGKIECRSLSVQIYFLIFELQLTFTYKY